MKQIITLTIFVLSTLIAKADCLDANTSCWPYGNTLNKNAIIILSTGDTDFALNLSSKYKIYLRCGTNKIQVMVMQVCRGGLNLIQLVLKPKTELIEGQEYDLCFLNSKKVLQQIKRWDIKSQNNIPIKWKVKNITDMELPVWKEEPVITAKFLETGGCGPDEWVHFHLSFIEKSDVQVKAVIKNVLTGKETICYIHQRDNKFQLGHTMCSGEFNFDEEAAYEVFFYLVDESGNISAAAKAIKFNKPDQPGWSN